MNLLVIYSDDENQLWYVLDDVDNDTLEHAKRISGFALGYTGLTGEQEDDGYNFLEKLEHAFVLVDGPLVIAKPTTIVNIHRAL